MKNTDEVNLLLEYALQMRIKIQSLLKKKKNKEAEEQREELRLIEDDAVPKLLLYSKDYEQFALYFMRSLERAARIRLNELIVRIPIVKRNDDDGRPHIGVADLQGELINLSPESELASLVKPLDLDKIMEVYSCNVCDLN